MISGVRIAAASRTASQGRPVTKRAQAAQKPLPGGFSGGWRNRGSRSDSIRWPRIESSAGISVTAPSTAVTTATADE